MNFPLLTNWWRNPPEITENMQPVPVPRHVEQDAKQNQDNSQNTEQQNNQDLDQNQNSAQNMLLSQPINVTIGRENVIAHIEGQVLTPDNEKVKGAVLKLFYGGYSTPVETAETDGKGRYRFRNLPPGYYSLRLYYNEECRGTLEALKLLGGTTFQQAWVLEEAVKQLPWEPEKLTLPAAAKEIADEPKPARLDDLPVSFIEFASVANSTYPGKATEDVLPLDEESSFVGIQTTYDKEQDQLPSIIEEKNCSEVNYDPVKINKQDALIAMENYDDEQTTAELTPVEQEYLLPKEPEEASAADPGIDSPASNDTNPYTQPRLGTMQGLHPFFFNPAGRPTANRLYPNTSKQLERYQTVRTQTNKHQQNNHQ